MKNYQYILFDWDGNLAKTLDVWLFVIRDFLKSHSLELSDKEVAYYFGALIELFESLGITDTDAALDQIVQAANQMLPDADLYPDALEVLEYLHDKGKEMALITTSSRSSINHALSKFQLGRLFKVVLCGDEVSRHKPDPEPLEKALGKLGGSKERAVMIGDSDKDLGAAKNFGMDSILFYPPEHEKYYELEKLKTLNPTYIVENFRDIEKIVI